MRKRLFELLLLVLAFLVLTGGRGSKPMYQPKPLSVPAGMSLDQVTEVVKRALSDRGWFIDDNVPADDGLSAEIIASLNVRVHSVKIKIAIDTSQIHMTYVSSVNMSYQESKFIATSRSVRKEKGPWIHPKYTTWLKNLELDVRTAFNEFK